MTASTMTGLSRHEAMPMNYPDRANPNRMQPAPAERRREPGSFSKRSDPDPLRARRPLTDEQRERVTCYMALARTLARRFRDEAVGYDEREAEAYAALVDAARTFDASRGVDFAIYARQRILSAIRDYRRFLFHANWERKRGEPPVFQRLAIDDDLPGQVIGRQPEAPVGRDIEVPEAVAAIVGRLPRSQAVACRMHYLEGRSCGETAAALGCSAGYVSRLLQDALLQLRHTHGEALAG